MNFSFTTREEYFAYKADWKNRYFETIKEIRKAALERREAERRFSKAGSYDYSWKSDDPIRKEYFASSSAQQTARNTHASLKAQATELLAERWESKVEAGRQMHAKKAVAA